MKKLHQLPLGLYEKALPYTENWNDILTEAKALGFSFVEMSIDESEQRLSRLYWKRAHIKMFLEAKYNTGMRVPSLCFSCHRAAPFGSADAVTRTRAWDYMRRGIDLADALGIKVIQLGGYDVYYEKPHAKSCDYFFEGLKKSVQYAAAAQVILAIETMDTVFLNSVSKVLSFIARIQSPWLQVYPDIGNISAWNDHPVHDILAGLAYTTMIHLKDTYKVTATCEGQFRDVPFGKGCVDFFDLFLALKKVQYQGPFLIEMWAREGIEEARRDIAHAKNYLISKMKGVYV